MDIAESLSRFGLDTKEQAVYLYLLRAGWSTALVVSRKSGIKRSTLYRVLDRLIDRGLVEQKVDDKTTFYQASSLRQFESMVIDAEEKSKRLRASLSGIQALLANIASGQSRDTNVHFYRGIAGLKHMEWKQCELSDSEILILDAGDKWFQLLGHDFAEEIRAEHVRKNNRIREIHNTGKGERIPPSGNVSYTSNTEYVLRHYDFREIPERVIPITQDMYVFRDTFQYHGYREGDVVGIEIVSQDLAIMVRAVFEVLWNIAKPLKHS